MNNESNSHIKKYSGLLIAFEGIDGSGKSTMARRTVAKLHDTGRNAVCLREPTDGPHGRRLRELLSSPEKRDAKREFELFLLDRRDDVEENILPVLNAGGVVCIDRYYISSMAYQGALGLDPEMIRLENERFAPIPDLILRYALPVEIALQRIQSSRPDGPNQFEKREYLEMVNACFDAMDFSQMREVNSASPEDKVFKITWNIVLSYVKKHLSDSV